MKQGERMNIKNFAAKQMIYLSLTVWLDKSVLETSTNHDIWKHDWIGEDFLDSNWRVRLVSCNFQFVDH